MSERRPPPKASPSVRPVRPDDPTSTSTSGAKSTTRRPSTVSTPVSTSGKAFDPSIAPPPPPPAPDIKALARRSKSLPDDVLWDQCDIDLFVASGPGGQHRNKTESGVRLVHRPTGTMVTATERRSQHENRSHALARLRERLEQLAFVAKPRRPTRRTRGSQERRLETKRRDAAVKQQRRSKDW